MFDSCSGHANLFLWHSWTNLATSSGSSGTVCFQTLARLASGPFTFLNSGIGS